MPLMLDRPLGDYVSKRLLQAGYWWTVVLATVGLLVAPFKVTIWLSGVSVPLGLAAALLTAFSIFSALGIGLRGARTMQQAVEKMWLSWEKPELPRRKQWEAARAAKRATSTGVQVSGEPLAATK